MPGTFLIIDDQSESLARSVDLIVDGCKKLTELKAENRKQTAAFRIIKFELNVTTNPRQKYCEKQCLKEK